MMEKLFLQESGLCIFQNFEAAAMMETVMTCILQAWRPPATAMWAQVPYELNICEYCE